MTWLLSTVVGLLVGLVVMSTGIIVLLYLAGRNAAAIEDAGDDDVEPYVDSMPPWPILHIGQSGQHDRYPIGDVLRQVWISHLDKSWNLPARKPGATR